MYLVLLKWAPVTACTSSLRIVLLRVVPRIGTDESNFLDSSKAGWQVPGHHSSYEAAPLILSGAGGMPSDWDLKRGKEEGNGKEEREEKPFPYIQDYCGVCGYCSKNNSNFSLKMSLMQLPVI